MYHSLHWAQVPFARVAAWRQDKLELSFEERRGRQRAYYEGLPTPALNPEQLIGKMRAERGLYDRHRAKMVEWYLYDANAKAVASAEAARDINSAVAAEIIGEYFRSRDSLIRQLVENLHFEVSLTLPEDGGSGDVSTVDRGLSSEIIRNRYNLLRDINPVLYGKLHEYSTRSDQPHFVYLLLKLKKTRADGYDRWTRSQDMLAFFRIYANYRRWPSIRRAVEQAVLDYPGEWKERRVIREILEVAEEQGPGPALDLYLKRYKTNYRHTKCIARDAADPNKVYRGDHTFEVWPGERDVRGRFRFDKIDSDRAILELGNVIKVDLIRRNGVDIRSLCKQRGPNIMVVPLVAGQVVEIEYVISVDPEQWQRYMFYPVPK
jgi:hypothetical protein